MSPTAHTAHQWIPLWVIERLNGKIDVQGRPVEVMRARQEHVRQLGDRCLSKPREVFEWHEPLTASHQEPEAGRRYVPYFNRRSVLPTLHGFQTLALTGRRR